MRRDVSFAVSYPDNSFLSDPGNMSRWQASVVLVALLVLASQNASSSASGSTCTCDDSSASNSVDKDVPFVAPNPKPRPASFCVGGTGGTLRRLSRFVLTT